MAIIMCTCQFISNYCRKFSLEKFYKKVKQYILQTLAVTISDVEHLSSEGRKKKAYQKD